jgi:hypothetical protein
MCDANKHRQAHRKKRKKTGTQKITVHINPHLCAREHMLPALATMQPTLMLIVIAVLTALVLTTPSWVFGAPSDGTPPFGVSVYTNMFHPEKALYVAFDAIVPMVPRDFVVIYVSIHTPSANDALDKAILPPDASPVRLRVGSCGALHTLRVETYSAQYLSLLATVDTDFWPGEYCLRLGMDADCFCESACATDGDTNLDGLPGREDVDCVRSPDPPNITMIRYNLDPVCAATQEVVAPNWCGCEAPYRLGIVGGELALTRPDDAVKIAMKWSADDAYWSLVDMPEHTALLGAYDPGASYMPHIMQWSQTRFGGVTDLCFTQTNALTAPLEPTYELASPVHQVSCQASSDAFYYAYVLAAHDGLELLAPEALRTLDGVQIHSTASVAPDTLMALVSARAVDAFGTATVTASLVVRHFFVDTHKYASRGGDALLINMYGAWSDNPAAAIALPDLAPFIVNETPFAPMIVRRGAVIVVTLDRCPSVELPIREPGVYSIDRLVFYEPHADSIHGGADDAGGAVGELISTRGGKGNKGNFVADVCASPNLKFFVVGDPDLGTAAIRPGSVYALTYNRPDDLVVRLHTLDDHGALLYIDRSVTVAAAAFAAPHGHPTIRILSIEGLAPSCAEMAAVWPLSIEVVFVVDDEDPESEYACAGTYMEPAPDTLPETHAAFEAEKQRVFYLQRTGIFKITCRSARFVVTHVLYLGENIADTRAMDAASRALPCPSSMMQGMQYATAFTLPSTGPDESGYVWDMQGEAYDARSSAHWLASGEMEFVLRGVSSAVPEIVAHIAMLSGGNDTAVFHCSRFAPPFVLEEPAFSELSFHHRVLSYPTCADGTDGVIELTHPPGVNVAMMISRCTPGGGAPEGACNSIELGASDIAAGTTLVHNVPFVHVLSIALEVADSCRHVIDISMSADDANAYLVSGISISRDYATGAHVAMARTRNTHVTWLVHSEYALPTSRTMSGNRYPVFTDAYVTSETTGDTLVMPTLPQMITVISSTPDMSCTSWHSADLREHIRTDGMRLPSIRVDATLSLPIFCPMEADALVVAEIRDLPDPLLLATRANVSIAFSDADSDAALDLPVIVHYPYVYVVGARPGTYIARLAYADVHGGVYVTQDAHMVALKNRYAVRIDTLPGDSPDTSDFVLRPSVNAEIDKFTADMLPSDARQYISDHGTGTTAIRGVPSGTGVDVRVRYDDERYMRSGACLHPLRLVSPKIYHQPPPVLVMQPDPDDTGTAIVTVANRTWRMAKAFSTIVVPPSLQLANLRPVTVITTNDVLKKTYSRCTLRPSRFAQHLQGSVRSGAVAVYGIGTTNFTVSSGTDTRSRMAAYADGTTQTPGRGRRRATRQGHADGEDDSADVRIAVRNTWMPPPARGDAVDAQIVNTGPQGQLRVYASAATAEHGIHVTCPQATRVYALHPSHVDGWPSVCTVDVPPCAAPVVAFAPLESAGGSSRQRSAKQARRTEAAGVVVPISTLTMTPLTFQCVITAPASSQYSADGSVRVLINGGQSPYILAWDDLPNAVIFEQTGNPSAYNRYGMAVGTYRVAIFDSLFVTNETTTLPPAGQQDTACLFDLTDTLSSALFISSVRVSLQSGCLAETVAYATPELSVATTDVSAVGVWRPGIDSPITACDDSRLRPVNNSADLSARIGVGAWLVAVCVDDTYVIQAEADMLATLDNETLPLVVVDLSAGQTCTPPSNLSATVTKVRAGFVLPDLVPPLRVLEGMTPLDVDISPGGVAAVATPLSTGAHTLFAVDARGCGSVFTLAVNNTGLEQCDNCNVSDTSCLDLCGVPFGDNACLYDCVIDAQVTQLYYVQQEIQGCVNNGTGVIALPSAPPITFTLTFTNLSYVNLSGAFVFSGCTLYLAPTLASIRGNATAYLVNATVSSGGLVVNNTLPENIVALVRTNTPADGGLLPPPPTFVAAPLYPTTVWLADTPLPTLRLSGDVWYGLIFTGRAHITLLELVGRTVDSADANKTLAAIICHYFVPFSAQIDYISVNDLPPTASAYAIDNICFAAGAAVKVSERQENKIHALYAAPIMLAVWALSYVVFFVALSI